MKAQQAINPLEGEQEKKPELEKRIEIKDSVVIKVLKAYSQLDFARSWVSRTDLNYPGITPAQIDFILQRLLSSTPKKQIQSEITGDFFTILIQMSYLGGHNDFVLNVMDAKIRDLGNYLNATKQRPLSLTINGSVGTDFGTGSRNCIYTIKGNMDGCILTGANDCKYFIEGEIGDFYFTSPLPGKMQNVIFETSNPRTYEKLKNARDSGDAFEVRLVKNETSTST